MRKRIKDVLILGFIVVIGWLFVIYEYAVRVSDSVILPALQHDFGLQAVQLGILSSSYYVVYVALMIPAGILIDRYGIYRVWALAIFTLAIGCFLFASAINLQMLIIARVLMGAGSAFCVIGLFSVVTGMMRHTSLLIGVTMATCMVGAFLGQGPWLHISEYLGRWQYTYYLAGAFGVILGLTWCILGRNIGFSLIPFSTLAQIRQTFKVLIKSPLFWVLAVFIGCLSTPQTAFMALWGPHFLASEYGISAKEAAYANSLIAIGGLFGAVYLGFLGDKVNTKPLLLTVAGVATVCMIAIIQKWVGSSVELMILLFILGFVTNANVIVFAYLGKYFIQLPRTTIQGATNVFNMSGGPLFQLLIGWGITADSGGVLQLNAVFMHRSLWIIPLSLLVMFTILWFTSVEQIKKQYSHNISTA